MPSDAIPITASRASLWFGLFGGATAWLLHFMAAYAVAEFGCVGGLSERTHWNITLVAWMELALTAVAMVVAATASGVAYRSHRRLMGDSAADTTADAERYTARAGLLTSSIFAFVILFEGIAIFFYLHGC